MKAKKPLLLVVLVVALLALALVLPAAASAKTPNPNQPVNWASAGGDTNNTFVNVDGISFQGGYSYLVKELSDHSLVGHVHLYIVKTVNIPGLAKNRDSSTWLTFKDPLGLLPDGSFFRLGTDKVVDFFAVFDLNGDGLFDPAAEMAAHIILVDAGQGRAGDQQLIWFSEEGAWSFFGTSGPSFGDVAIHLAE